MFKCQLQHFLAWCTTKLSLMKMQLQMCLFCRWHGNSHRDREHKKIMLLKLSIIPNNIKELWVISLTDKECLFRTQDLVHWCLKINCKYYIIEFYIVILYNSGILSSANRFSEYLSQELGWWFHSWFCHHQQYWHLLLHSSEALTSR